MLAARNPNVARAPKPSKVPSTPWSSIVKKGALRQPPPETPHLSADLGAVALATPAPAAAPAAAALVVAAAAPAPADCRASRARRNRARRRRARRRRASGDRAADDGGRPALRGPAGAAGAAGAAATDPPAPPADPPAAPPSPAPKPRPARAAASPAKRSPPKSPPEPAAGGGRTAKPLLKKQATGPRHHEHHRHHHHHHRQPQHRRREAAAPPAPPPPPPPPPPCDFGGRWAPLSLPGGGAMAALDAAVGAFVEGERAAARRADGAMAALMAAVEAEARALWPGASVAAFGSRATELASGASDLDLVVVGVPELDQFAGASPDSQLRLLAELAPRLAAIPGVASAALQKSSVPVVAVVADAPAADAAADAADAAAAPAPAAARLRVDVSLQTAQHSGLVAAEHVRCLHACLPALAPIVVVLKALLNRHHLKSAFTGGLSSYALTVMVARFLLHHQAFFAWPGADADGAGERDGDADGGAGPKLPLVVAGGAAAGAIGGGAAARVHALLRRRLFPRRPRRRRRPRRVGRRRAVRRRLRPPRLRRARPL